MAQHTDIQGFTIFSQGEVGLAHAEAHQFLDQGAYQEGYDSLWTWLSFRRGAGSQWVHLQWHLLVCELELGKWQDAHARYLQYMSPAIRSGQDAATDAPAALWRLALSAAHPVDLPWHEVRTAAERRLLEPRDSYVELHDLLALAGAGDTRNLSRWLGQRQSCSASSHGLSQFAAALLCFAERDYANAARWFALALPKLNSLGGSRAQNQLFYAIYRVALQNSAANDGAGTHGLERVVGVA